MSGESTDVIVPVEVRDQYNEIADRLDGFEDGEALILYILEQGVYELEQDIDSRSVSSGETVDDETVTNRLKQLGYME